MICCDATYRLNWLDYPVFIVGLASPTGKFRISLVVISSHEDHIAQAKILSFVKSQGINPSFLMGELFSIYPNLQGSIEALPIYQMLGEHSQKKMSQIVEKVHNFLDPLSTLGKCGLF